jgi:pimeloyl-ACP methyl ester carboxylesterase
MPPRTLYTKSGNVSIAYQVTGDGPIDLVFAPGWVSNVEYAWENPDYARLITRLSSFSRFIRFDKRGTGLSDRDVKPSTLEQRVDDIRAVMDAVGSERAALLGMSEGGNMSVMFTATSRAQRGTRSFWLFCQGEVGTRLSLGKHTAAT